MTFVEYPAPWAGSTDFYAHAMEIVDAARQDRRPHPVYALHDGRVTETRADWGLPVPADPLAHALFAAFGAAAPCGTVVEPGDRWFIAMEAAAFAVLAATVPQHLARLLAHLVASAAMVHGNRSFQ